MEIIIRRKLPSQNLWNNKQGSMRIYAAERNKWRTLLQRELGPPRDCPPQKKVHMRIVSYRKRLCDWANLVGGAKPIPDCMIRLGYLRDDSPKWMVCEYEQIRSSDERTEIMWHEEGE